MSVSELYEYWHVALRIGTESFIVRRTQQRLKADEITVREATEGLRSYEVVAISRFGSLEECARRTQTGVCDITPSEPGECNLAHTHDGAMAREWRPGSTRVLRMNETNTGPRPARHIVTPTYVGPDRRRRRRPSGRMPRAGSSHLTQNVTASSMRWDSSAGGMMI